MPRLLVIGRGRMGTLVESLAAEHGFELAGVVNGRTTDALGGDAFGAVDVAIDFTVADAVSLNLPALAARVRGVRHHPRPRRRAQ